MAQWKAAEKERLAKNNEIRKAHRAAVEEWSVEAALAKSERRRASWTKPKQPPLLKGDPKPVLRKQRRRTTEEPASAQESDSEGQTSDEEMDVDGDEYRN
ncbi:hypothetical protein NMY22_g20135 [Coprinellus aureogranulatus]|nr:hypothetical protein NMY22_g20135 [Coprinellus aureogranulatus]